MNRIYGAIGLSISALVGCTSASAAIVGATGATNWLTSAPANCSPTFLMGPTVYAWDEQQNVTTSGVFVDMVNSGPSSGAIPGVIAGTFNSHFLHLEDYSGAGPFNGSVTFDGPIIGVIFNNLTLDATDATYGAGGTIYPTAYPFRGLGPQSSFTVSGNTINFSLMWISPVADVMQIRVLTHPVPAPGPLALVGLGGLAMARRRR